MRCTEFLLCFIGFEWVLTGFSLLNAIGLLVFISPGLKSTFTDFTLLICVLRGR